MGLKTTNYYQKETDLLLPVAYASLGDLVVNRYTNKARAIFLIQATRENSLTKKPLDEVKIEFVWDRKSDPVKMAYEVAKTQTISLDKIDEITGETISAVELGKLYGWQVDFV